MKILLPFFLILTFNTTAQRNFSCNCEGFVDNDYKGIISLLDKPNGNVIKLFKHNLKKEDYLIFSIDKVSDSFFHVKIQNAISGDSGQGWIRKSKHLVTFIRNYKSAISLYSEPSSTSKVKTKISNTSPGPFEIFNCAQSWMYIRKIENQTKLEGWLWSKDQCANPYTTCN